MSPKKIHTYMHHLLLAGLLGLSGCWQGTAAPDYTIEVQKTANGSVAIPPKCLDYRTESPNNLDNQPDPQFGCATQRNLAMMIEKPEDLLHGRPLGPASGVLANGSILRYNANQTRGLIMTGQDSSVVAVTTSSSATSALSGDVTGAAANSSSAAGATGSNSSSSSASPAIAAATSGP